MLKNLKVYIQYLLPQHLLSRLAGVLANCRSAWLKNFLIVQFMRIYRIDLTCAEVTDPKTYETFNDFFCRSLSTAHQPRARESLSVISPSEGKIAQMGRIEHNQLLQAKGRYFSLEDLLGDQAVAQQFQGGHFATIYLAPPNYHRVHMPVSGTLLHTIFIPGKLFSVNQQTSALIPNLYARNERLVALFTTEAGPMAVILVGAMIVGSIDTVWKSATSHPVHIEVEHFPHSGPGSITLEQGAELGRFKLGSTVVMLFGKDRIDWLTGLEPGTIVTAGMEVGRVDVVA